MRDRIWVLSIASVVLVADQVTKAMVSAWIPLYSRVPVIDGFLAFTHVRNRGAAFGLFADAPSGALRYVLIVVSVLAVGLIWAYAREGWHQPRIVGAFGLILGGAIGNLVDRVRLHEVVDFVDVYWGDFHWWSFNVADAAITVGAVTLFVSMTWETEAPEGDDSSEAAPPPAADPNATTDRNATTDNTAEDPARVS